MSFVSQGTLAINAIGRPIVAHKESLYDYISFRRMSMTILLLGLLIARNVFRLILSDDVSVL